MLNEGNRRFKIANISSRKWSHTSLVLANVQREKEKFVFSILRISVKSRIKLMFSQQTNMGGVFLSLVYTFYD